MCDSRRPTPKLEVAVRRRGGMRGRSEPYRPAREGAGIRGRARGMTDTLRNCCDRRLHLVDDEGGGPADLVVEGAGPAVVLLGVPVDLVRPPLRPRLLDRQQQGAADV